MLVGWLLKAASYGPELDLLVLQCSVLFLVWYSMVNRSYRTVKYRTEKNMAEHGSYKIQCTLTFLLPSLTECYLCILQCSIKSRHPNNSALLPSFQHFTTAIHVQMESFQCIVSFKNSAVKFQWFTEGAEYNKLYCKTCMIFFFHLEE